MIAGRPRNLIGKATPVVMLAATRCVRGNRDISVERPVPIAGAMLDAVENGLQLSMMLGTPTDAIARAAFTVSNAKMVAIYVGVVLLTGAVLAQVQERQKRRLRQAS